MAIVVVLGWTREDEGGGSLRGWCDLRATWDSESCGPHAIVGDVGFLHRLAKGF
jgi:hypothetical protein